MRDHGIGMTPEAVRRVCERFFRADTSGNIPGTGWAWRSSGRSSTCSGGRLAIESAPQQATVRIVPPLAAEPAPVAELAEPAPPEHPPIIRRFFLPGARRAGAPDSPDTEDFMGSDSHDHDGPHEGPDQDAQAARSWRWCSPSSCRSS